MLHIDVVASRCVPGEGNIATIGRNRGGKGVPLPPNCSPDGNAETSCVVFSFRVPQKCVRSVGGVETCRFVASDVKAMNRPSSEIDGQ